MCLTSSPLPMGPISLTRAAAQREQERPPQGSQARAPKLVRCLSLHPVFSTPQASKHSSKYSGQTPLLPRGREGSLQQGAREAGSGRRRRQTHRLRGGDLRGWSRKQRVNTKDNKGKTRPSLGHPLPCRRAGMDGIK